MSGQDVFIYYDEFKYSNSSPFPELADKLQFRGNFNFDINVYLDYKHNMSMEEVKDYLVDYFLKEVSSFTMYLEFNIKISKYH